MYQIWCKNKEKNIVTYEENVKLYNMYILKLTEKKNYFLRKISDNFKIRTQENLQIVLASLKNSSFKVSLSFRNNCMSQNGDLSA